MKDVYAVSRQKELEFSRLEDEFEALRVIAPLLLADGEAEDYDEPTLQRALNDTSASTTVWKDGAKKLNRKFFEFSSITGKK